MNRSWLVTGATGGLGRAIVEAALAAGDSVVATSRQPNMLDDVVSRYGSRIRVIALDVSDPDACQKAVAGVVDAFGTVDVVVNNAGFATSAAAEDLTDDELRRHVDTNFYGAVHITKAALPIMRAQKHGLIVQMSSVAGRFGGTPGLAAYYASKRALEGWTEVLAAEVKPFDVDVVLVEPGAFNTNFVTTAEHVAPSPQYVATVGSRQTYRRQQDGKAPGDPDRAAEVIVQLSRMVDPPLRLLLGSDAVNGARKSAQMSMAQISEWEPTSRSTDYEGRSG